MLQLSKNSFPFFMQHIFPLSFRKNYTEAPHTYQWAEIMQKNDKVALLSARKHLKSTTLYAYMMWKLLHIDRDYEVLYLSYKADLAQYHTKIIKDLISKNIFFAHFRDLTQAESVLKYENWQGYKFVVEPEGVMSFKRGRHPDEVICDDILADPSNELNLQVIEKISRTFFEDIMSLPKEGGRVFVFGTPQHQADLFFKLKEIESWTWSENKAIIDEINQIVLWKELFGYDRLCEIREKEIGEKAFRKEYMCSPIYTEEAFFQREDLLPLINKDLDNSLGVPTFQYDMIIAGLDIGKHVHPSHLSVFAKQGDKYIQIYSKFYDNQEYIKQVEAIKNLQRLFNIRQIYFDATRGEFEGFLEQGVLDKAVWRPVKFTSKEKYSLAANFEKVVREKRIELINDPRQINSILAVNNDLEALETTEGYGDAFFSIAMALSHDIRQKLCFASVSWK
jgi:hypothetical protein